jgi:Na+/melibiose symporter-like transporter
MGSVPAGLSMILIPIVSYKSDRHRGRWGRRIPFLLAPTPVIVLSMVGLAFCPQVGRLIHHALGARSPGLDECILIFICASWAIFEIACITAGSVFTALINDVVPREVLGRFFGAWRALSLIAGMIFFYWGFGGADTYFLWYFLGIAALYGGGFTLMCLKVKEGSYPAQVPMDIGRDTKGFLHAARTYAQECFGSSYYWLYYFAIAFAYQGGLPISLFSIFYSKSLNMPGADYGLCITISFGCSLVLSYPLGMLADRFHPLQLGICVQFIYALVSLWGALFIHDARTFGIAIVANSVLNGTFYTAMASIGQRLLPRAEFAQFNSANSVVGSVVVMVLGPAIGIFLDHMHHAYRLTFLISFVITAFSLLLSFFLYRRFQAYGGPENYVAPEGNRPKAARVPAPAVST